VHIFDENKEILISEVWTENPDLGSYCPQTPCLEGIWGTFFARKMGCPVRL